ncbi:hypothetical protein N7539_002084 [Penicillium diatomitis]|uniref:ferric-chelate reductase (NADPH) n=1 Tax=Penicillium diatomitis TaxID=2819901 RepID=A0A9W9XHX9_9EURO|nr:uncharacterized protein N7539_002084 [Penicillium diatomitis]KAJ5493338.1 hypothetical protein N7539_002084 [Penicillium diatomitis]
MGVELQGNGVDEAPMNPTLAVPLYAMAGFVSILFFWRMLIRIAHRRRRLRAQQETDQIQLAGTNQLTSLLKKHVSYAPFYGTRHSRELRVGRLHMGTLPLRLEMILLIIYLGLNLIFIFVMVDWWEDYSEKMYQLKFAAGHLAVMNTPGLVLSAGRNNPLIQLLEIPFDTFNLMHRWVGRVIAANAVVHMSAVLANQGYLHGKEYIAYTIWRMPFYIYGLIAVLGFVFIVLQSWSPVRHAFYELFLHLHIALAIMSFVALWYHLKNLLQQRVLLGTLILWGLDRASRLIVLLWRNLGKRPTNATVELLPGSVARVDIEVCRAWTFRPGQYLYLYLPCLGLWTSHPFTVAWASSDSTHSLEKRDSEDSLATLVNRSDRQTMSILIKSQDGFTKKLHRKVEASFDGRLQATALAEGPFGGIHSLESYGTLLLVAGGIGITHAVSYLRKLIDDPSSSHKTATRRMHLVWVVRNMSHLTWIQPWMNEIFNHDMLSRTTHPGAQASGENLGATLSISIYVTGHKEDLEDYVPGSKPTWVFHAPKHIPLTIDQERPDMKTLVQREQKDQVGAMAVSVCGPGSLGDSVRDAVRDIQGGEDR